MGNSYGKTPYLQGFLTKYADYTEKAVRKIKLKKIGTKNPQSADFSKSAENLRKP